MCDVNHQDWTLRRGTRHDYDIIAEMFMEYMFFLHHSISRGWGSSAYYVYLCIYSVICVSIFSFIVWERQRRRTEKQRDRESEGQRKREISAYAIAGQASDTGPRNCRSNQDGILAWSPLLGSMCVRVFERERERERERDAQDRASFLRVCWQYF